MTAIGLSLIVVSFANLLIGAAALLPRNPAMFGHDCVPLSAAMLFLGVAASAFGLIA